MTTNGVMRVFNCILISRLSELGEEGERAIEKMMRKPDKPITFAEISRAFAEQQKRGKIKENSQ